MGTAPSGSKANATLSILLWLDIYIRSAPAGGLMAAMGEVPDCFRYYHVFRQGELEELVAQLPGVSVIDGCYDHANWCVVVFKAEDCLSPASP